MFASSSCAVQEAGFKVAGDVVMLERPEQPAVEAHHS
jgi:hypothetical protein